MLRVLIAILHDAIHEFKYNIALNILFFDNLIKRTQYSNIR